MNTATITNTGARFLGEGRVEFRTTEMGPVAAGEVRLRVDVCALCGSDKRLLAQGSSVVPGHEIAGTVAAAGADAAVAPDTRGIVYIPVYCGACPACHSGLTNRCTRYTDLIGWQRDGGFAHYVDVPARCLIEAPEDVPLDVAVLGLDTVGTAAHGLRLALRTQQETPRRLLVVGCGPLGLGVVAVARAMGVEQVDAYDPHPGRLALAVKLGAAEARDLDSQNQYDVTVEVSGAQAGRAAAQRVIVPGGAVVVLGESGEPYTMPADPRWRRTDCFTVRSFYFPLTEVAENWELLRGFGAELRDVLAERLTLPELEAAFDAFVAGDLLKPYIVSGADS
ncbi:threonine 3-dehydrogenase [Haloactinopolyspora alba]|uniref:Threonine 3-dehydrogenase n=1 Tax=Haloactinopolyspora alba TaxID=648780 RepID=A0A2P8E986_9ACTN|nr:alcohol dehydrogenase catalytic domain-containing protein [Haloactinopolyspora alba]PSL06041.1 threonine 3-dehydrogenase [Haloactinopolyspora alba]